MAKSKGILRKSRFDVKSLVIFGLVFVAIGSVILFKSYAAQANYVGFLNFSNVNTSTSSGIDIFHDVPECLDAPGIITNPDQCTVIRMSTPTSTLYFNQNYADIGNSNGQQIKQVCYIVAAQSPNDIHAEFVGLGNSIQATLAGNHNFKPKFQSI